MIRSQVIANQVMNFNNKDHILFKDAILVVLIQQQPKGQLHLRS